MTEHIANVLTEHMFADGLIECDDKEIYHYAIQVLIEKIIGFSTIFLFSIMWESFWKQYSSFCAFLVLESIPVDFIQKVMRVVL